MPKPTPSDAVTLAGVIGLVVAIAALAGGWWALAFASAVLVAVGYNLHRSEAAPGPPPPVGREGQP